MGVLSLLAEARKYPSGVIVLQASSMSDLMNLGMSNPKQDLESIHFHALTCLTYN